MKTSIVFILAFAILGGVLATISYTSLKQTDNLTSKIIDESSFANIDEVRTEHFDLELNISFDKKTFHGVQTLHMKSHTFNLQHVYLDIENLKIENVTNDKFEPLNFTIDSPNPILGQRLIINNPKKWYKVGQFIIIITYETSTDASAITWLNAEQTTGKRLPYMYTQCESIHARSIAPFQDSPSVKATYNLKTLTRTDIVTRASGNLTHEYTDENYRYTTFEMKIPVQSYLLAIASGNLADKQVGARSWVISEPEDLEKAATELDSLEHFLTVAENITIPYEWGDYKILILPPSFPYGGMENPLLTFASPAIIVGDKSSVDVAIHEIAHSWFGNLVTNINWSNFWLNEGFTVYLERKVSAKIDGVINTKVAAKLENQTMYYQMLDFGMDSNYTSLHPIMNGSHPDDSMSTIPYEKGFQFLTYLESLIGEDHMLALLREYIKENQYTSVDEQKFIKKFNNYVYWNFKRSEKKEILAQVDFETWIHGPGLPPITVDLETDEYNMAIALAQGFLDGKVDPAAKDMYQNFTVNLKGLFISHLIDNIALVDSAMAKTVDGALAVGKEINGELIFRWQQVAIRSGYQAAPFATADTFVGSIGRMKFVVPVYVALNAMDPKSAKSIFAKHEDFYHPIAKDAIRNALALNISPTLVSA
jgi:leukotriene-A4 hydrolase